MRPFIYVIPYRPTEDPLNLHSSWLQLTSLHHVIRNQNENRVVHRSTCPLHTEEVFLQIKYSISNLLHLIHQIHHPQFISQPAVDSLVLPEAYLQDLDFTTDTIRHPSPHHPSLIFILNLHLLLTPTPSHSLDADRPPLLLLLLVILPHEDNLPLVD